MAFITFHSRPEPRSYVSNILNLFVETSTSHPPLDAAHTSQTSVKFNEACFGYAGGQRQKRVLCYIPVTNAYNSNKKLLSMAEMYTLFYLRDRNVGYIHSHPIYSFRFLYTDIKLKTLGKKFCSLLNIHNPCCIYQTATDVHYAREPNICSIPHCKVEKEIERNRCTYSAKFLHVYSYI